MFIVFDSRTIHRVTEVTGGIRKTPGRMGNWTEVEMIHYKEWTVIQFKKLAVAPILIEEPPIRKRESLDMIRKVE